MNVRHLASAHPDWRAVFDDDSLSRVVAWAVVGDGADERFVGVIVDPSDPGRLVAAPEARTPEGSTFVRYGLRSDTSS